MMWYLYLSKHTNVFIYMYNHTHIYKCSCWICMQECIYIQYLPPITPSAQPLLFVMYIKILNVWMIKTSCFFFPKEEFTGISDWEGRPLSLHSDHFLIVYSYLKSSFKILFTSQFSSQPSPSPIPLYFPCLLMPHASLQPRTEWFRHKHSLIGEFPQCSFETSILLWWHVTSFTGQTWLRV